MILFDIDFEVFSFDVLSGSRFKFKVKIFSQFVHEISLIQNMIYMTKTLQYKSFLLRVLKSMLHCAEFGCLHNLILIYFGFI